MLELHMGKFVIHVTITCFDHGEHPAWTTCVVVYNILYMEIPYLIKPTFYV